MQGSRVQRDGTSNLLGTLSLLVTAGFTVGVEVTNFAGVTSHVKEFNENTAIFWRVLDKSLTFPPSNNTAVLLDEVLEE